MGTKHLSLIAIVGLAALTACTPEGRTRTADAAEAPASTAATAPNVITVTAADFHFQSPTSVPAGMTTIRLVNNGPELHHVQLVRLEEGHTVQDFLEAMGAGGPPPSWAVWVGGPNTPVPDGRSVSEATLDLEAGNYAMLCIIPSADGVPHVMKGMVLPLTVTPVSGPAAAEPAADLTMVLDDYSFDMSTPLTAGRRTIRVENVAEQPHEVILVRLAPGKTLQDMLDWAATESGPPPGAPIAGTTAIAKAGVNYVTAHFAPGEYALICFIPDAGDGKPHVMHGMARQISVR